MTTLTAEVTEALTSAGLAPAGDTCGGFTVAPLPADRTSRVTVSWHARGDTAAEAGRQQCLAVLRQQGYPAFTFFGRNDTVLVSVLPRKAAR